jgi:putative sterol carrier protein
MFQQTLLSFIQPNGQQQTFEQQTETPTPPQQQAISPEQLLGLIEPLINESLVNEIKTLYEFNIKNEQNEQIKKFYINLKYDQGSVGYGNYLVENPTAKFDCCIKINEFDLNEILLERLAPFNAYMSGRIEIDGNLSDVLKLKKILTSLAIKK